MRVNNYKELDVWKISVDLSIRIYRVTEGSKFNRDYALRDQVRRSAISIPSNIAEGFERNNNNEFVTFLRIAKASCAELSTQLHISQAVGRITDKEHGEFEAILDELIKKIGSFISYLKTRKKHNDFVFK